MEKFFNLIVIIPGDTHVNEEYDVPFIGVLMFQVLEVDDTYENGVTFNSAYQGW